MTAHASSAAPLHLIVDNSRQPSEIEHPALHATAATRDSGVTTRALHRRRIRPFARARNRVRTRYGSLLRSVNHFLAQHCGLGRYRPSHRDETSTPSPGVLSHGRPGRQVSDHSRNQLRHRRLSLNDDTGAVTAEYAVVILAAVAFAGLLVVIMRSSEIRQMLVDLVQGALTSAG